MNWGLRLWTESRRQVDLGPLGTLESAGELDQVQVPNAQLKRVQGDAKLHHESFDILEV